jgi:hypothetical protein
MSWSSAPQAKYSGHAGVSVKPSAITAVLRGTLLGVLP